MVISALFLWWLCSLLPILYHVIFFLFSNIFFATSGKFFIVLFLVILLLVVVSGMALSLAVNHLCCLIENNLCVLIVNVVRYIYWKHWIISILALLDSTTKIVLKISSICSLYRLIIARKKKKEDCHRPG